MLNVCLYEGGRAAATRSVNVDLRDCLMEEGDQLRLGVVRESDIADVHRRAANIC